MSTESEASQPAVPLALFPALRETFRSGYSLATLRSDALAGLVVGLVALPLGMALGIASGVPPQHGLYTVVVAGLVVAALGGSRFQVTGPTAAFVVVLVPIAHKYGVGGLLLAGFLAGVMLLLMGLARMGQLIEFIPYPVTTGFTAGIGVVIIGLQVKDFFGLRVPHQPDRFLERAEALWKAHGSWSPVELAVAALTLSILVLWPKVNKRIPSPLVALTVMTVGVAVAVRVVPGLEISTIASRFRTVVDGVVVHGIPQGPPALDWPWNFGADPPLALSLATLKSLIPPAFAIAMLGAIESLLSAVVADGMAQTDHDPDSELVALGVGNILCPFFGGIAATGAIARTATNIRFGGRTPVAAMLHAVFVLAAVLLLAPWVSLLPMASLAALLVLVGYNMIERKHFEHILSVAPRSDVIVLLLCFTLTVIFDMVAGVTLGVMLAALLFMRRMATITSGQVLTEHHHLRLPEPLPKQVLLYEIAGPLFFGAAERAMEAVSDINEDIRAVIIDLEDVPVMDMTGLVAFGSALRKLNQGGKVALLVGVRPQPADLIERSGMLHDPEKAKICATLEEAIRIARARVAQGGRPSPVHK